MTSVRILGIDPGYDRLGWAVLEVHARTPRFIAAGCVQTKKGQPLYQRYQQIQDELEVCLITHLPQEVAIETVLFSKNQTTAMQVSEVRGLVLASCFRHQLTCFDYNPMQMKLAVTGHGQAEKSAVERMVRLQLTLPATRQLDDTMDAIGIALTHAVSRTSHL